MQQHGWSVIIERVSLQIGWSILLSGKDSEIEEDNLFPVTMMHASDREKWPKKSSGMENRKQQIPDNSTNSLWYNRIRVNYCNVIRAKNWVENIPEKSHRFLKNV